MNFLYPAFLLGALAVAVPIVLHLLRRDVAPEVPFSAVRLLRRSPIEQSRRRRLRDLLLLAARAAALLLLAAAFARPYIPGASATASLHIVAIDRSFSMGAPGRFDQARDFARAAVRDAGLNDRVAVIGFDDSAEVIAAPGSRSDAEAALETLQSGFGTTRYVPAIARAAEIADGAPARLIVITDLQRSGWEGGQAVTVPSTLHVDIQDVGEPTPNLGILAVKLEQGRAIATIRNTGAQRTGRMKAAVDGRPIAEVPFIVEAASSTDVPVPVRETSGVLTVSVEDGNGIPADDARHLLLDPERRPRVLLVTGAPGTGFYLSRALTVAAADDAGFDVRVVDGKALAAMSDAELGGHAAMVLLSTRGLDRRDRDALGVFVRRGGGLFITAANDIDTSVLSAALGWEPPLIAAEHVSGVALSPTDLRHPIFRPFGVLAANLGQVRFTRAWRVGEDGWDVAARFTDGAPALLERRDGNGRIVLFTSDLDRRWNDFPLHPGFVPFAVESVRHVIGARSRVGEYLIADAPAGVPRAPGAVRLPSEDRTIVLNVDTRESDATRMTAAEFSNMLQPVEQAPGLATAARAQQEEGRQSYWQYGLLLMLCALVMESVIGRP